MTHAFQELGQRSELEQRMGCSPLPTTHSQPPKAAATHCPEKVGTWAQHPDRAASTWTLCMVVIRSSWQPLEPSRPLLCFPALVVPEKQPKPTPKPAEASPSPEALRDWGPCGHAHALPSQGLPAPDRECMLGTHSIRAASWGPPDLPAWSLLLSEQQPHWVHSHHCPEPWAWGSGHFRRAA